jgi:hypothetical protein
MLPLARTCSPLRACSLLAAGSPERLLARLRGGEALAYRGVALSGEALLEGLRALLRDLLRDLRRGAGLVARCSDSGARGAALWTLDRGLAGGCALAGSAFAAGSGWGGAGAASGG